MSGVDELMIPIARRRWWVAVVLIGALALIPLGMMTFAVWHALTSAQPSVVMIVGLTTLGLPLGVVTGGMLASALRTLRSPGLRLCAEGFELNGGWLAWTDVQEFRPVADGETGHITHITAVCRPGRVSKYNAVRRALGLRAAPTRLYLNAFDTGDVALVDILRRWQARATGQNSVN